VTNRFARILILAVALFGCCIPSLAQDQKQVLEATVNFAIIKSRASADKRAEVDQLGQKAQSAATAGNYSEALKDYYHAFALIRNVPWTPASAVAASLSVRIDQTVSEPGQTIHVDAKRLFLGDSEPADKYDAAVVLLKPNDNQPVKTLKTISSTAADLGGHPLKLDVVLPEVEDGNYLVALSLKPQSDSATEIVSRIRPMIHIEHGIAQKVQAANTKLNMLKTKFKAEHHDDLLSALAVVEYQLSMLSQPSDSDVNITQIKFDNELDEANKLLSAFESGTNPFAGKHGDFKMALYSTVDHTVQPYRLLIPSSYDGSKPFPLIIALHGAGRDENSFFDDYPNGAFKNEAEQRGYIVACPKGRQPTSMYLGPAEQDVMDVIAQVRKNYKIDPNRIYMTGHSMGGFGTWSIAMDHPDIFAAIAPISGGGNPANVAKIAHIPELVVHGDADQIVPVNSSRVMVEAAKKAGAEVKYIEVPGGSHVDVAVPNFKNIFDWFDSHRKGADAKAAGHQ